MKYFVSFKGAAEKIQDPQVCEILMFLGEGIQQPFKVQYSLA